ncbi:MAG: ATP-dependent helicase HrpB [Nitrospira sp.]|nr:ATP-dependent helicase HrpB [Nitrospira sp.]
MTFPVDSLIPELQEKLSAHNNVVLQAAPGAGKTTRVPIALLTASWLQGKKIIMLEPRRITARAAARFMATSLGQQTGETVGYRIRQDSRIGPDTRIEVVTEGILTRILQHNPALEEYGVVIFDEFHERNLNSDLGLALCLDAQQGLRDDLRILVMSATMDTSAIALLLGNAPVITSSGRSYPVTVNYQALKPDYHQNRRSFLQGVAGAVTDILDTEPGGMLVFLPGAGEIQQVYKFLQARPLPGNVILTPLYGQLSPQQQDQAIQPPPAGQRKVVIASAIAESSLTIEGIRIVIDAGLMRTPRFDANSGLSRLTTLPVSQASADQRCGRAGRLEPGTCYRLWSQQQYLLPFTAPEILDADLAPLLLELACWGVTDPASLCWLQPPPAAHAAQARDLLQQLGALDSSGKATRHGQAMARWGMHPRLSHMVLRSVDLGLGVLACELAALLNDRDPIRGDAGRSCDLRLRIELLRNPTANGDIHQGAMKSIRDSARQWQRQLQAHGIGAGDDLDQIGVLLAFAYPDRIGQRRQQSFNRYLLSNGRGARLPEADQLSTAEYIVAANLDDGREARIFLGAAIGKHQLLEHQQELLQLHHRIYWDDINACVQSRRQTCAGEVVITDEPWPEADPEQVANALLSGIRQQGCQCLPWNEQSRVLQARATFLHQHIGNSWPDMQDTALMASLETWLAPFLGTVTRLSQLQKINLHDALLARLSWDQQQQLQRLAPSHITVASGSRIALDYGSYPPVLAVRLQEMFGESDTPRIADGNIAVLLHLLSPARRPVQITGDLAGFWRSSYHEVKKELKGRYPKHYWPDDPLQAQACKGVVRKKKP